MKSKTERGEIMSVNVLTQNGLQRIHTVRVQKDSKIRESDVNFYDYDGTIGFVTARK